MSKIVEGAGGEQLELDERSKEPVLKPAAITAAVGFVLSLAISFGLDLSDVQQGAILGLATIAAPFVAGWLARRRAWSGRKVAEVLDIQLDKATRP